MWCSKLYDIIGMGTDEDNIVVVERTSVRSSLPIINDESQTNGVNHQTIVQHDSPFSEKCDSPLYNSEQLINSVSSAHRDYRDEHVCVDPHVSCHQCDGQNLSDSTERSYRIATISNATLNLSEFIGNREENFRRNDQLSRSHSLNIPELKNIHSTFSSMSDLSSNVRYSLTPQRQDSFGYRISTRSTTSISNSDLQSKQIAEDIRYRIKQMLNQDSNEDLPMILHLSNGFHRIEGHYDEISRWNPLTNFSMEDCFIESDNVASIYSSSFYEKTHYNYYGIDNDSNPVVMSIKLESDQMMVIVRTKDESKYHESKFNEAETINYVSLIKEICPNVQIDQVENCPNVKSEQFIKNFDEKLEIQKFKFGVIYQRRGQTTEEEFFNNQNPIPLFEEFLSLIATRVPLKNFKGYRAGLDISEQTDSPNSYYECFSGKEIMFHVSTLLPFTPNDSTQIQRKRHIGNDIVAIVFQEENTPFHPSMIKSSFLHVFLVIQPVQIESKIFYKMMMITRNDVKDFSPRLFPNVVYPHSAEILKSFILCKLINAEYASYRCETFSSLQERTRCSYLKILCEELAEKSYQTFCDEQKRLSSRRSSTRSRRGYLSSMKKIFSRSSTLPEELRSHEKHRSSKKLWKMGKSLDQDDGMKLEDRITEEQQDSIIADDSDEGLDSLSSSDTTRVQYDSDDQEAYRRQIREKSQMSYVKYEHDGNSPQSVDIHTSHVSTV